MPSTISVSHEKKVFQPVVEVWLTAEVEEELPVTEDEPVGDDVVVVVSEEDAIDFG